MINNKITNKRLKIAYISFTLLIISFFLIISLFKDVNTIFALSIITYVSFLMICIPNYKNNISILMFLMCFFIFLMGSYFAYEYLDYTEGVVLFDENTQNHIYLSILIALISIFFGYFFARFGADYKNNEVNKEKELLVQSSSLILFYLSYIPYITIEFLRVIKVREIGYTGLYLENIVNLPYIITLFAYGCRIYFFIYLSTLPSKNKSRLPIILFFIYSAVSLFTGNRSTFVVNVSLIFIYYIFRSKNSSVRDNWINERNIIFIIILVPILLYLLDLVGNIRFNNTLFEQESSSTLIDIFVKQGVSSSVIGYGKIYNYKIPEKIYSFGDIYEKIRFNPISVLVMGGKFISGNSVERAINGNSFAHIISYIVLPFGYLRGRGLGTTYIAEAYHDFGYLGIILFSFIYGVILKKCRNFENSNYFKRSIILIVLGSLLMTPRSNADDILSIFLQTEVIFSFILLRLLILASRRKLIFK